MSLTTTTVRNLGSFEIVTTKPTVIRPPPRKPAPKRYKPVYASSLRSYESDLESVLEDSPTTTRLSPPRRTHQAKISFSPAPSINDSEPIKHNPPPRSLSPSKPSLKDHSRTGSIGSLVSSDEGNTATSLQPHPAPVKRHSVSFSDQPSESSLSQYASNVTTPATSRESRQSFIIPKQPATARNPNAGINTGQRAGPHAPNRQSGLPSKSNPAVSVTRKSSITETAASAAAKMHAKQPIEKRPNAQATAAAKLSSERNNNSHHYRAIAFEEEPHENKLTEAAVTKLNANGVNGKSTEDLIADPAEFSDDDTISMNSDSSWRRPRAPRHKMGFSVRDHEDEPKSVDPKSALASPILIVKEPKTQGASLGAMPEEDVIPIPTSTVAPASILKKPSARLGPDPPRVVRSQAPAKALVLKRTPSTSSFERGPSGSSSAFKMMSLRDQPIGGGGGFSRGSGPPGTAAPSSRMMGSRFADSDSEDEGYSRSARTAAPPPNRMSLRTNGPSPNNRAHQGGRSRPTAPAVTAVAAPAAAAAHNDSNSKKTGMFGRIKQERVSSLPPPPHQPSQRATMESRFYTDNAAVSPPPSSSSAQASGKKLRFKGLRKVFGLDK